MSDKEKQDTPAKDTETPKQPLVINTQYLKDLSFESPNSPAMLVEMKKAPDIAVNLDVKAANIKDDLFHISLIINAEAKYEGKTVFICETEFCAVATINVAPEHLEPVLLVEIPKFLFPSAREIIATTTRNGGFAPLLLNPIDFMALYIAKKQQANAEAAKSASAKDKPEDKKDKKN